MNSDLNSGATAPTLQANKPVVSVPTTVNVAPAAQPKARPQRTGKKSAAPAATTFTPMAK